MKTTLSLPSSPVSACPLRAPEIAETRAVLEGYGFPVAPVTISERRAFARAVASGKAVTEFEGEGKAAAEIRALWSLQEIMVRGLSQVFTSKGLPGIGA